MKTQNMISDCLGQIFGPESNDTKLRLSSYEKQKYVDLNTAILKDNGIHNLTAEMERIVKAGSEIAQKGGGTGFVMEMPKPFLSPYPNKFKKSFGNSEV